MQKRCKVNHSRRALQVFFAFYALKIHGFSLNYRNSLHHDGCFKVDSERLNASICDCRMSEGHTLGGFVYPVLLFSSESGILFGVM